MLADITSAIELVFTLQNLTFAAIGIAIGLVFGALPGLSGNVALGLLLPFTFYLDPVTGIITLLAISNGANFGGSIPAVLLNIPGTPAATFTAIDGYQLTKSGHAKKALHAALYGSTLGNLLSDLVLIFVAAPLAAVALMIGPPEYAAIILFSLTIIGTMIGKSLIKGLISTAFGLLLGMVGRDLFTMDERFTFGIPNLDDGIPIMALIMGILVLSEVLVQLRRSASSPQLTGTETGKLQLKKSAAPLARRELRGLLPTIFKGGIIGTFVGSVPGLGATLGAFLAHSEAKRSVRPEDAQVGRGSLKGVAAAESGNSATTGANLIPLVTLGIPGNIAAALILGAFMIHGITPGPFLMQNQGPMLYAIFFGLILSNIFLLMIGFVFIHLARFILAIDKMLLLPAILFVACVGTYATTRDIFSVGLMFVFGVFGYGMRRLGFTPIPMILAFILSPLLENGIRRSLALSGGSLDIFFEQPIALVFLIMTLLMISVLVLSSVKKRRSSTISTAENGTGSSQDTDKQL